MIVLQDRLTLAPNVRLQTDPLTNEPVLLYPEGLLVLNESAQAILALCDGARTLEQIATALADGYEAPRTQLQEDVLECLRDLRARNLVVFA